MLVEAVAVLVVVGLLLMVVLPTAPSGTSRPRFEALVASAAALLRDARSQAIGTGASVSARFDAGLRRLQGGRGNLAIPADVAVGLAAGGTCPSDGTRIARIVFRSDGTNCGGVFRFARGQRVMKVRVSWIDGRIDVLPGD